MESGTKIGLIIPTFPPPHTGTSTSSASQDKKVESLHHRPPPFLNFTLLYKVNCHFFPIILAWQFGLVWCDLFWGILPLSILLEQLKWLIHFSLDMCWYSLVWFKIGLVWLQDPLYHLNDGRQRSRNAFSSTLQSVNGKCMKTSLPRLLLASLFKSWLRCTIGIWSYFKIISQI